MMSAVSISISNPGHEKYTGTEASIGRITFEEIDRDGNSKYIRNPVSKISYPTGWFSPGEDYRISPPSIVLPRTSDNVVAFIRAPEYVTISYTGLPAPVLRERQLAGPKWEPLSQKFHLYLPHMLYVVNLLPATMHNKHSQRTVIGGINLYGIFPKRNLHIEEWSCAYLPLPNVYDTGEFCLPGGNILANLPIYSYEDLFTAVYDVVWGSNFNKDIIAVSAEYFRELERELSEEEEENGEYPYPELFEFMPDLSNEISRSYSALLAAWEKLPASAVLTETTWLFPEGENDYYGRRIMMNEGTFAMNWGNLVDKISNSVKWV